MYSDVLAQDTDMTAGLICNFFEEDEDTGVGLYCVKVMFIEVDEKTGKEKRSNENIYAEYRTSYIGMHVASKL